MSKSFKISIISVVFHILSASAALVFFLIVSNRLSDISHLERQALTPLVLTIFSIECIGVFLAQLSSSIGIIITQKRMKKKLHFDFCIISLAADVSVILFSIFSLSSLLSGEVNKAVILFSVIIALFIALSLADAILSIIASKTFPKLNNEEEEQ